MMLLWMLLSQFNDVISVSTYRRSLTYLQVSEWQRHHSYLAAFPPRDVNEILHMLQTNIRHTLARFLKHNLNAPFSLYVVQEWNAAKHVFV